MELILLSLLGLGMLAGLGGMFDSDNAADEEDDVPEEGSEVGELFEVVGNDTLDAGGGNDTIVGADDDESVPVSSLLVNGGEGDDLIELANSSNVELYGDAGNDTIVASNTYLSSAYGGDGDDEIIGGGGEASFYGGNGDDVISVIASTAPHGNGAHGGDGDDTIIAISKLQQSEHAGASFLVGGDGRDQFTLSFSSVTDPISNPDDPAIGSDVYCCRVWDFVPADDQLVIDLSDLDSTDAAFVGYEIAVQGTSTYVTVTFDNGATGKIIVDGVTGLTDSHISVVS